MPKRARPFSVIDKQKRKANLAERMPNENPEELEQKMGNFYNARRIP